MSEAKIPYKIYLSEEEMPRAWYNVRADMKVKPAPLLDPATGKPMGFEDLRGVFCDELIRQELDDDDGGDPHPAGHPRLLQDVPPLAAGPRLLPGGEAGHAGENLLQVRGQQHLRLATS